MEGRTKRTAVRVAVVSFCALLLIYVFLVSPWLDKRGILSAIAGADRVVAHTSSGQNAEDRVQIEFRDSKDIEALIAAVRSASQDNGRYSAALSVVVEFYREETLLEIMNTGCGLFRCQGNQYRDKSGSIQKLVCFRLYELYEAERKSSEAHNPRVQTDSEQRGR